MLLSVDSMVDVCPIIVHQPLNTRILAGAKSTFPTRPAHAQPRKQGLCALSGD